MNEIGNFRSEVGAASDIEREMFGRIANVPVLAEIDETERDPEIVGFALADRERGEWRDELPPIAARSRREHRPGQERRACPKWMPSLLVAKALSSAAYSCATRSAGRVSPLGARCQAPSR